MRKWARKGLVLIALLLVSMAALSGVGVALFKGAPEGYAVEATSDAERAALARQAENKLIEAQNWAATVRADEQRAAGRRAASAAPAPRAPATYQVELSQHELNALFNKWSVMHGWRDRYRAFLEEPRLLLRDGRLILAGQVKELGAITSFHFRPNLDSDGNLRLDLVKAAAGRLPLPESIWSRWRDAMVGSLQEKAPRWGAAARIDTSGAANLPAMAATLSRLLVAVADQRAAEPVLFFPLAENGASVPVRIAEIEVADGALKMRVQPLTPAERTALLQRIRTPSATPPARHAQASGQ